MGQRMKVYWSNRTERLVEELSQVLREPLDDPFQPETIGVNSAGIAQWLMMELSRRLGICAGVRFPQPEELIHEAYIAVLGYEADTLEAWLPGRLRWAILDLLPGMLDRPELGHLALYLRDDPGLAGKRSCHLALRIAESLQRYLIFRQSMIRGWSNGEDAGWQSELYRALRARIGAPNLAELSIEFARRCHEPDLVIPSCFPSRICLFGVTTLAPSTMRALSALARHVDVHLFVLSPTGESPHLTTKGPMPSDALEDHADDPPLRAQVMIDGDPPLLSSMGRLSREFQVLLKEHVELEAAPRDLGSDPWPEQGSATMLRVLQTDIFHRRSRGATEGPKPWTVDSRDRSLSIHACHGAMRQVEVLRDQLLALFDEHHDLQPRDVIVMTPDIETYAPLIQAVFDERHRTSRHVPFRIADISPRRKSPVIEALLRIIDIAGTRMTAPDVLDLLALEPVRTRCDISSEDVDQIIKWVSETGIRWGIDASHRVRHGQPPYVENSWRFGLDRLLLGYAAPGQNRWLYHGVLPYDEVEGGVGVLLGQLVEFCTRLFRACTALEQGPMLLVQWRELLTRILDELVATTGSTSWEHELLRGTLGDFVAEAASVGFDRPIELEAVRAFLVERLSKADEAGFGAGQLTFCGMMPHRSIPARVVCLLGMDDGAFPRSSSLAGFDLTLWNPRLGDRSERDDDRQLFLDALLSARDRVLVFTSGRSVKNNQALPPSTVVSELIDTMVRSFVIRNADGATEAPEDPRDAMPRHLVVQHPLQPFSPRSYGATRDERLFTFTEDYLGGARALLASRHGPMPFIEGLLPSISEESISLTSVLNFFDQPIRALLERRLGVGFRDDELIIDDHEPLELDRLEQYRLAQPLLERHLRGEDVERTFAAVQAGGVLPWGTPGRCVFEEVVQALGPVAQAVLRLQAGDELLSPLAVDLTLKNARLTGRVESLWSRGLIIHRFARLNAKHLLRAWITHLTLGCQRRGDAQSSFIVGRQPEGRGARTYELSLPPDPRAILEDLLLLYRAGLSAPLLFFPETSKAYADAVLEEGDGDQQDVRRRALEVARKKWVRGGFAGARPGEGDDQAIRRVLGPKLPFDTELPLPPLDKVPTTFHDLALTVWSPLMNHLREVT